MKDARPFIASADADRLHSVGRIHHFQSGDTILAQGATGETLFVLRQGRAHVRCDRFGHEISIETVAPGEPLGAISFAEGRPTTRAVVAEGEVEVAAYQREALDELFAAEPELAARFYQSLAAHLAGRLRHALDILPSAMTPAAEAPQRVSVERDLSLRDDAVSPALAGAVALFRTVMLCVERALIDKTIDDEEAQRQTSHACDELSTALAEQAQGDCPEALAQGAFAFRETFPTFMKSRFFDRVFSKPLGYAGDYGTIELIYSNQPAGEGRMGRFLDRWIMDRPAPRAVRSRRSFLTDLIREEATHWRESTPMPITSLGSGPAREVFDLFEADPDPRIHVTCLDIDAEALACAATEARRLGVSDSMTFVRDNLVRLARGHGSTNLPAQKLIYSVGVIDYLNDDFVVLLLNWIYDHLQLGGAVVLGNFDVANPDRAFMDHIAEWSLRHRSPEQLRGLFGRSKFGVSIVAIMAPEVGVQLFARCVKE